MKNVIAALVLATSVSTVGFAQETDATIRAYAAGYKAAFTCSATFNGGKSPEQIEAQELTGIYPLVADVVPTLEAKIDHDAKRVTVAFSDTLPPRISQWRPHLGCTQLPVGAKAETTAALPRIDIDVPARNDSAPWSRIPSNYGEADNEALAALVARAFKDPKYGKDAFTTALLVASPDEILIESYIDGYTHRTSQRTWSVAKSIAASVIGAAVEEGQIDIKAPAPVASWQSPLDPRKGITLENLLHMASGLDSNQAGNRTDRLYIGGGRVDDTAMRTSLEVNPGSRWKYANNDTLLAVRALKDAIGDEQAYLEFPFEALLHKIGMLDTVPEVDWGGNFVMSSQVWTTSRDLARLGILYLNDGTWNGERILPEGWAKYVATSAPSQPPAARANGSAIPGYGAQFWLYNERFPELPNDSFAALGNRGQILMIIPSKNLVIVRRGHDPAGGEGFQIHSFAADVLKALE
ncbi:serine hydrolase domain-containing protein [Kordiimonas lipolytica]|uniref:Serine hydrolase domain-containing protein n=1 Tax=Kordiimonas lipolytica TaxID=1662421 RepID=A0ABV8UF42_9PROT|nr:serine hydrolase [Kordiimonas lipolytica]